MADYQYNVFLSWTGADRALKNQIRQYFVQKSGNPDFCYDSDEFCLSGHFRDNYMEALRQSKVYLLLLTDSLFRNVDSYISEVLKEFNGALDAEAHRNLNIVVLCTSQAYRNFDPYKDKVDPSDMRLAYFNGLSAHSVFFRDALPNGLLSEADLAEVCKEVEQLISLRDNGKPALPTKLRLPVESVAPSADSSFVGRAFEEQAVRQAFEEGKRIVVLWGMGGMGKTQIANRFAQIVQREKLLYYVQTVNVGEQTSADTNCLKLIAAKTVFTSEVNDQLNRMSTEEQKTDYRIALLKQLPEYCLLVVDNLNNVNDDTLNALLALPCRLLITTRAGLRGTDKIAVQKIDSMQRSDAYKLFCERSGKTLTDKQFDALWIAARQHTMTLCIMAGILRSRPTMTAEQLVQRFSESLEVDTAVNFQHNDNILYKDLMGHLDACFVISELSPLQCDILRNLSVISDGTMSLDNLLSYMHLPNDNDVYSLISTGWLDSNTRGGVQYLTLHPIKAQLMLHRMPVTEQNVAGAIDYLQNVYASRKDTLRYTGLQVLQDKLLYAIKALAHSTHRLCMSLWKVFTEVYRLTGDIDLLQRNCQSLRQELTEEDAKTVDLYCDTSLIEVNPEQFGRLERLRNYKVDSSNYRELIKLAVVAGNYAQVEDRTPFAEISSAILPVAMQDNNDIGVISCISMTDAQHLPKRQINRYIARRKSEGAPKGALLTMQFLTKAILAFNSVNDCMTAFNRFNDLDDSQVVAEMIRHPRLLMLVLSANKMFSQIGKMDPSDPYYAYWSSILSLSDRLVESNTISVENLLKGVFSLYQLQIENDVTWLTPDELVARVVTLVKQFPQHMQGELQSLASVPLVSADEMTINDVFRLNVACSISGLLVSGKYGKEREMYVRQAMEQNRHLLEVETRLNAPDNYKAIAALIKYADACNLCGQQTEATGAFAKAYKRLTKLQEEGRDVSGRLQSLCSAILASGSFWGTEGIVRVWYSLVLKTELRLGDESQCITALVNYCSRLLEAKDKWGGAYKGILADIDAAVTELLARLDAAHPDSKLQLNILWQVFNLCKSMRGRYFKVLHSDRFVAYFDKMRTFADAQVSDWSTVFGLLCRAWTMTEEESVADRLAALDFCLSKRLFDCFVLHDCLCTSIRVLLGEQVDIDNLVDALYSSKYKYKDYWKLTLKAYFDKCLAEPSNLSDDWRLYYAVSGKLSGVLYGHYTQMSYVVRHLKGSVKRRRNIFLNAIFEEFN